MKVLSALFAAGLLALAEEQPGRTALHTSTLVRHLEPLRAVLRGQRQLDMGRLLRVQVQVEVHDRFNER